MYLRLFSIGVLFLALSSFASAQNLGTPPACTRFGPNVGCLWGHLFDGTPSTGDPFNPAAHAINHGPLDLCRGNDPSCLAPLQTICETNSSTGGAWFFAFPANTTYVIKPRVIGTHISWFPVSASFFATSQLTQTIDFVLTATAGTGQC